MSGPPEEWEPRFDALPGSELPRYIPEADEPDEHEEFLERYGHDDFSDNGYSEADHQDVDEEEPPSAEPLNIPRETPEPEASFRGYGRNGFRPTGPIVQEAPGRPEYRQDQVGAAAYQPEARTIPSATVKREMKISLWGSPASGKTTFLAVLRHAAEGRDKESHSDIGEWSIYPMSALSTRLMANFTHELSQGNFPNPTVPGEEIPLEWLFVGDITNSRFARRRILSRRRVESRFVLDLVDVSGHAFGYLPDKERVPVPTQVSEQALKRLVESDGIIYLFDPIGERDNQNSYSYVNRVVTELKYRAAANNAAGPRLDKQIAVCITKFDEPEVFQAARRNGFVSIGDDGVPRVPDEHAEEFFELFTTDSFWRKRYEQSARSAELIRRELRQVFSPQNIKYYVTSSIGFYRPPGWRSNGARFDSADFVNVVQGAAGRPKIRGAIHPINVLEPLVGVHQRFTGRS
jgi:hypothetical protein